MTELASIREVFAARLLEARQDRQISQFELACRIGMHQSHIAHFESGRRTPNVKNLIALCAALGVTADYLLGRQPPG